MDTQELVNLVIQESKGFLDTQEFREKMDKVVTQAQMAYPDIADCPDLVGYKVSQDIMAPLVYRVIRGLKDHPVTQESWDYLGTLELPDFQVYRDIQVMKDQVDTAEYLAKVVTRVLKERLDSQEYQDILVKSASQVIQESQELQVTVDSMVLMENPVTRVFLDFTDLVDIRVSLVTQDKKG